MTEVHYHHRRDGEPLFDLDGKYIDLSAFNNVLDTALWQQLTDALMTNDSVTSLNVSNNAITADMAEMLGHLLSVNGNIAVLTCTHSNMNDVAASCILRGARKTKSLRSLNLASNPITDVALTEVEKLVFVSAKLEELVLLDTHITFEGCVKLVEAMVTNTSLLNCSLPFVLGHQLLDQVQSVLTRNWRMLTHDAEGASRTVIALRHLAERDAELRRTQWKRADVQAEGLASSYRLTTVAATRGEWTDPSTKTHLIYLTLLDRKCAREDELKRDAETVNAVLSGRDRVSRQPSRRSAASSSPRLPSIRVPTSTPRPSRSSSGRQHRGGSVKLGGGA